jgi:hypothetical protein
MLLPLSPPSLLLFSGRPVVLLACHLPQLPFNLSPHDLVLLKTHDGQSGSPGFPARPVCVETHIALPSCRIRNLPISAVRDPLSAALP